MSRRNNDFKSHAPFHQEITHVSSAHLNHTPNDTTGPFSFLNPTSARFYHHSKSDSAHKPNGQGHISYKWSSGNNRKGRHALIISRAAHESPDIATPPPSSDVKQILIGVGRMVTRYPYWDISWLIAYGFTWGSIIWVLNAMFVYIPLLRPSSEFSDEVLDGAGITAFLGATIFEFASILLMLETMNENRTGDFGWAVEELVDNEKQMLKVTADHTHCQHFHENRHGLLQEPRLANQEHQDRSKEYKLGANDLEHCKSPYENAHQKSWTWLVSWADFKSHYARDIGFLACTSQFLGASVFWISGFTALPGIQNKLSAGPVINGVYWAPQVIGGSGFIVSGILFMLETQTIWWKPSFTTLGWHIGAWNLIGGVGFTLSGAFGFETKSWGSYQSACSTFWGSFAFLIGSVIQLYESLEKRPVSVED